MPTQNYLEFLSAHYECDGTGVLVDSVAADNFTELGTVPEVSAGKFGAARGPCNGVWNTGGNGFEITPNGVFETRVANGFIRATQMGWFNLDANTVDQEFSSQAQSSLGNAFQQYMVRGLHNLGGGNQSPVIFIWDHTANNFSFATGAGRGSAGAMPTDTWCFLGWSVDLPTDTLRFFNGIPGEPAYFIELTNLDIITPFEATLIGSALLGVGSGHSGTAGLNGSIDHVDWWQGVAYDEEDFLYFWNNGRGRAFPNGYKRSGAGVYQYYWDAARRIA